MKNLDVLQAEKAEIMVAMQAAITSNDEEAFGKAFADFTDMLQKAVMDEAKGYVQASDNQVLIGRGLRVLTSSEKGYYESVIEAMRSANPKQALTNITKVMPETIIDTIFEDMKEEHPLLSKIKFENTGALQKILYSTGGRHEAVWGPLCGEITEQLAAAFDFLPLEQTKLSAFVPVCKDMLDLGPAWIDRYVRAILLESIANGIEKGIVKGRGIATANATAANRIYEPVGMIKDLTNYDTTTGYGDKTAEPIIEFSPQRYGELVANLAVGPTGLYRKVTSVLLVVNPVDYFKKILPATIHQRTDGTFVTDIFPFPTEVVQSVHLDEGQAILGLAQKYYMALGTGKEGRIEYSDEYKFLEDDRYYLIKLYGNGRPLDNNSFTLLNIKNLKPKYQTVRTLPLKDAELSVLEGKVSGSDKVPTFKADTYKYNIDLTGTGDTATMAFKAVAADPNASVAVEFNGESQTLTSGEKSLTMAEGVNVIVVTVTNGDEVKVYIVVVVYTKTT